MTRQITQIALNTNTHGSSMPELELEPEPVSVCSSCAFENIHFEVYGEGDLCVSVCGGSCHL